MITSPALEFMHGQGNYDNAILVYQLGLNNQNTVFVGGGSADIFDPSQMIFMTTNGGTSWTDITQDAAGNSPHNAVHAIVDAVPGSPTVDFGTDGGIWQLNVAT